MSQEFNAYYSITSHQHDDQTRNPRRQLVHFQPYATRSSSYNIKLTRIFSEAAQLRSQLEKNLAVVKLIPALDYQPPMDRCKALIGPHAGYSYSGPAAAWAYAAIPVSKIKRVFLLGPSHHFYLSKIAVSGCEKYATPLGDIPIDTDTIEKLRKTGKFDVMDLETDSDEHSLEMHLPYIRLMFQKSPDMKLVPLLVGNVSESSAAEYAEVFQEYWNDDETFWIISSDFCHWGTRFSHTPYYPNPPPIVNPVPPTESIGSAAASAILPLELVTLSRSTPANQLQTPIWQSIQYMDHEAMDILRKGGREGTGKEFRKYLKRTGNTICGRNPISVLVAIMEAAAKTSEAPPEIVFVRYEQSSPCESVRDSSVSYVSGLVVV